MAPISSSDWDHLNRSLDSPAMLATRDEMIQCPLESTITGASISAIVPDTTVTATTLPTPPAPAFPNNDARYPINCLESSLTVQIWYPLNNAQASTSTFSKTPLLRDVPQVRKKLSKKDRDSGSLLSDSSRSFQTLKSAAPNWLKEKPSRQKLASQFTSTGLSSSNLSIQSPSSSYLPLPNPNIPEVKGFWKKATLVCRETGILVIYSEDRSLLYSIPINDLLCSDIRFVDHSLFSCPNVLGIFSRPSTLHTGVRSPPLGRIAISSSSSNNNGHSNNNNNGNSNVMKEDPIYLCFPTTISLKRWRALLRTFAKPEIFGTPQKGGTHRSYRQVDMTILEARLNSDRPLLPSRSDGYLSPSSYDDADEDEVYVPMGALGLHQVINPKMSREIDKASPVKDGSEAETPFVSSVTTNNLETDILMKMKTPAPASVKSSEEDSDLEMTSGPISGLSGKDRITENSSPRSIKLSLFGESDRRPNVEKPVNYNASSYCLLWYAGDVVAQTKTCTGSSQSMTWFDKFSLKDLPLLQSLQIDIMQTGRSSSKVNLLGSVNLNLDTMRRGEVIEGWFPIWTTRGGTRGDSESGSLLEDPSFTSEMVGEIKISLYVIEETMLQLKKYAAIEEALDSKNCISLIQTLCKRLEEDRMIAYLVEIYASKGSIVDRLSDLIDVESYTFGENAALLFRGNTILTRAIDKYQRMFCRDWLDACIGDTVRKVCRDRIHLESNDEKHIYNVPPLDDDRVNGSHSNGNVVNTESNLEALKRLCREIWTNIYANRYECPRDLQSALYKVRTKVNSLRFKPSENLHPLGPGIQGVGAFVFLRLICPAITSPNLYGLMGSAPSAASSKTLMLVAKVFLALANKKIAFDKDKESWLVQANDFLVTQASAYDEFITIISTEPIDGLKEVSKIPLGDEVDHEFQEKISRIVDLLPSLPRESIPTAKYVLDRPLALASLVSYVVREATLDPIPYSRSASDLRGVGGGAGGGGGGGGKSGGNLEQIQARQKQYEEFIDLCYDVEDKVGYYIDRAGFKPEPIDFNTWKATGTMTMTSSNTAKRSRSTHIHAANSTSNTNILSNGSHNQGEKTDLIKIRRATVSDLQNSPQSKNQSPSYSNVNFVGIPRMSTVGEDSVLMNIAPRPFRSDLITTSIQGKFSSNDIMIDDSAPFQSTNFHPVESENEARNSSNGAIRSSADRNSKIATRSTSTTMAYKSIGEVSSSVQSSKQRWWKK